MLPVTNSDLCKCRFNCHGHLQVGNMMILYAKCWKQGARFKKFAFCRLHDFCWYQTYIGIADLWSKRSISLQINEKKETVLVISDVI